MRVGLWLPLGKQTGWTWHTRDNVRKDIAAAGNVTSWQLVGQQWDRRTIRSIRRNYLEKTKTRSIHYNIHILCVWWKRKLEIQPANNQPATQTRCRTSPSRCWWRRRHHCKHYPLETGPETLVPGHPEGSNSRPDRPQTQRRRVPRCTLSWQHWCHRK